MSQETQEATRTIVAALCQQIKTLPQEQINALEHRATVLNKAFDRLNERLKNLPERQKKAALTLLYRKMIDNIFEFHLAIEHLQSREKLTSLLGGNLTRETGTKLLAEYEATITEMMELYS
jgi:hypothetical protein